ncbi:MAG: response regulator transcription factor [Verrucomicrobiota bacterium]|nr:response regulator transcription factor [Verrucomicrobiota bacterium]
MCATTRSEPKPLILVIEDEDELAKLIATHLEESGMQTQVYNRCAHALRFLKRNFANLLLLDVNLPDQTGFSLLEELRKNDISIPTIFLTGNALEVNKVKGLDLGGDDYITKPFGYPELVARINAVLRRAESKDDHHVTKNARISDEPFDFCGAQVTPIRLEVAFPNGTVKKIGRKELGILAYLNQNQGVVITRKALIHAVWGLHADVRSRSLDQYIVKVRELFKENGLDLAAFRTVHGVGYIFDPRGVSTEGR